MNDESLMPFGKYRGAKLADVPASYLLWLWDKEDGLWRDAPGRVNAELRAYIVETFNALEMDETDYVVKHRP